MEKKMYASPALEIMKLENSVQLLAGSEGRPGVGGGNGGNTQSLIDTPDSKPVFTGAFGNDDE